MEGNIEKAQNVDLLFLGVLLVRFLTPNFTPK